MGPAAVMAIATGKMNTVPGWYPKWNTCWCVCGGLSRAIGTCCLYYLAGFVAVTVLYNYMLYDNTVFSLNESLTMSILRLERKLRSALCGNFPSSALRRTMDKKVG